MSHYGIEGLLAALTYTDGPAALEIAGKISEISTADDKSTLLQALAREDESVIAYVAEVLGRRPDFQASVELLQLLKDESPLIRGLAIRAVGRLRCKEATDLLLASRKDTAQVFEYGPQRVCDFAAIALAKLGDKRAIRGLLDAILSYNYDVRAEATQLLINLANKSVLPNLVRILQAKTQSSREAALAVINAFEFPENEQSLVELLTSNNASVRDDTIERLKRTAGLSGLIAALGYSNSSAYWHIASKIDQSVTLMDKELLEAALSTVN